MDIAQDGEGVVANRGRREVNAEFGWPADQREAHRAPDLGPAFSRLCANRGSPTLIVSLKRRDQTGEVGGVKHVLRFRNPNRRSGSRLHLLDFI